MLTPPVYSLYASILHTAFKLKFKLALALNHFKKKSNKGEEPENEANHSIFK